MDLNLDFEKIIDRSVSTERLKRNLKTLQVLATAPERQRKAIKDTSTRDQLLCL